MKIWGLRMGLLGAVIGVALGFSSVVKADDHVGDEPAVLNAPVNALQEAKAIVDVLAPTAEAIYNFQDETWMYGTSGSLVEFKSNGLHLGRIKIGYGSTNLYYTGFDIDIPGLVSRFASGRIAALDSVMGVISKYGSTGYIVGYDTNDDEIAHGFSLGATLRF